MKLPSQVAPALWGAAGGALGLAILGFTWFGWVGPGTAETRAQARAETALVAALTPICLEQFRASPDAAAQFEALEKIQYSWEKGPFVEKAGWATFAGTSKPNSDVARACAESIEKHGLPKATPAAEANNRPQGSPAQ
jgi:hypothetical protein